MEQEQIYCTVSPAIKEQIKDRIDCERIMFAYDMIYFIEDDCNTLIEALNSALWKSEKTKITENQDERLDDGSTDIDSLDAFEYSFERHITKINDFASRKRGDAVYDRKNSK